MNVYQIVDAATGRVIGTQTVDPHYAPVVGAGQRADYVPGGFALAGGSFTATGNGAAVEVLGNFNIAVWGTFDATAVLERSFDGGTTYLPATFIGGGGVTLTAPMSSTWSEVEAGVLYRLRCSEFVSGEMNWRLSQ